MRALDYTDLFSYLERSKISRATIDLIPPAALKAIWEIALNIRLGSLPLCEDDKAYFDKHKNTIKRLSTKRFSVKTKKSLLKPALLKRLLSSFIKATKNGKKDETSA